MRRRAAVPIVVLAAAACLAAIKSADKGEAPAFQSEGYTLTCTEIDTHSKVELAEKGEKDHVLEIEGVITPPEHEDLVAVARELKVVKAVDAEQTDLVKKDPAKTRTDSGYQKIVFVPAQNGKGEVEIKRLQLTANAYRVRSMTVEAQAIVSRGRDNKRFPAAVMEEAQDFVPGLSVRVESLKVAANRDFSILIRYTRNAPGTPGAFLEQAWVLDEDGTKIGGSRWSEGDPFGKTGQIGAKFKLAGNAAIKYVRLVAVTEYDVKTVSFEIRDIFQK